VATAVAGTLPHVRRTNGVRDRARTGTIYSFIVQRQPAVPGYLDVIPYIVALVELDEQPRLRLPGRLIGIAPEAVTRGMRVRAELVGLPGGDFTVPVFRTEQP
jgi:uncharacterized protein